MREKEYYVFLPFVDCGIDLVARIEREITLTKHVTLAPGEAKGFRLHDIKAVVVIKNEGTEPLKVNVDLLWKSFMIIL